MSAVHRHAIYFAPAADHPLWDAGCRWLQRDPASPGTGWAEPARPHIGEPRRYGFHATLKPPLRLREPWSETALLGAVARLASHTRAFEMPELKVGMLDRFLALRPTAEVPAGHPLRRLADACVEQLDLFRAEPDDTERARRAALPLSPRQRAYLQRYGYSYVLDEWRFHMTLSDPLPEAEQDLHASLAAEAREHFAASLAVPLRCDSLCVYVEPGPRQPFVLAHRFELAS